MGNQAGPHRVEVPAVAPSAIVGAMAARFVAVGRHALLGDHERLARAVGNPAERRRRIIALRARGTYVETEIGSNDNPMELQVLGDSIDARVGGGAAPVGAMPPKKIADKVGARKLLGGLSTRSCLPGVTPA